MRTHFSHIDADSPPAIPGVPTSLLQRILDRIFDDPERKREVDLPFKPKLKIDTTKSKAGLAELYEQQYLQQARKEREADQDEDPHALESDEEGDMPEEKREILKLFRSLCQKLNGSNRRLSGQLCGAFRLLPSMSVHFKVGE